MKSTILFILAFMIFIISFGCEKKELNEIKIGAILPLTGSGAKYGQSAKNGIELALEEINESGGINGNIIKVIYEDSKLEPKEGISAIRKFLTIEKVPAIIGAMASSVTLAIAPIAEENKIVLLSPTSSSADITDAGDYIFRNTYSDIYEGGRMASYVYVHKKYHRVGILHINNDFGVGLSRNFTERFEELGGKVVITESYEQDATDFRSQLSKVEQTNPDAIYLVGYSEMGTILRQAKELRIETPFFSCILFEDPKILETAGEAADGVFYAFPAYNPDSGSEHISKFVQAFEKKYGKKPNIYAASSYDSMKILAKAMEQGGFSSNGIKEALYSIKDFQGVTGKTSFDQNGDVTKPIGIKQVNNGEFVWVHGEF